MIVLGAGFGGGVVFEETGTCAMAVWSELWWRRVVCCWWTGRSWAGFAAHVAGQAIENSDGGLLRDASNAGSGLAWSRPCVLLVQAGRRCFSRRVLEVGQNVLHRNRFVALAPLAGFGTGEFFLYAIFPGGEPFPDERRVSCLRTIAFNRECLILFAPSSCLLHRNAKWRCIRTGGLGRAGRSGTSAAVSRGDS